MTILPGTSLPENHALDVLDNDHPDVQAATDGNPEGQQHTLYGPWDLLRDLQHKAFNWREASFLANYRGGSVRCLFRGERDFVCGREVKTRLRRLIEDQISPYTHTAEGWTDLLSKSQHRKVSAVARHLPEMVNQLHESGHDELYRKDHPLEEDKCFWDLVKEHMSLRRLLCQMQHYGSPTNLLDCTLDLHVALFFACQGNSSKDGCVRGISVPADTVLEPDLPGDLRVQAQRSVFCWLPSGGAQPDEEDWEFIRVPADCKTTLLRYLSTVHNISPRTMFPDLIGAIHHTNAVENMIGPTERQRKLKLAADYEIEF